MAVEVNEVTICYHVEKFDVVKRVPTHLLINFFYQLYPIIVKPASTFTVPASKGGEPDFSILPKLAQKGIVCFNVEAVIALLGIPVVIYQRENTFPQVRRQKFLLMGEQVKLFNVSGTEYF